MAENIRVLIVDDHAIVRRGLHSLLEVTAGMEVAGEASNGQEGIEKAATLDPDVILLDLVMPHKDGIQAIIEIKQKDPSARILVLTSFSEDDKVFPAIKAGALGYLLKDSSPEDLLQAIRNVYQGASSLHPTIARKLINEINQPTNLKPTEEPLTGREADVLKLIARGLSNKDIAGELVISEGTVRVHVSSILGKLHLASRTQAALYAIREGLASMGSPE